MFYDKFKALCDSAGISCNKAALTVGLSNATPTKWKKTGATPDGSTVAKLTAYFGVPTDFLLERPPFDCWDLINQNRKGFLYYVDIDPNTLKIIWGIDPKDPDATPMKDFISFLSMAIENVWPTSEGDWEIALRPGFKKEKMLTLEGDRYQEDLDTENVQDNCLQHRQFNKSASSLSDEALRLALAYDKQLDTWGRIQVRTAMEQALTRRAEDARAIQEKDNCIQLPLAIQTMGKGIAIQLPDSDFETILVEGNEDTRRAIFAVRVCGNNSDWYDNDILLFEKDSYNGLNMFVIDGLSQIMTRADDKIYPIWVGKEVISLTADIKCRGHAFCFLRPEWVKGNKPIFPEGYQFKW
ncbi:hypothetical protein D7V91_15765 [bacterium 1xD42-67]|nr:hypothetical protein D7V91_15765 [bacterium 1xD42-67]